MEKDHHELVVVLLNYQTPDLVISCLQTLQPEIVNLDAICCVVDNDSQDDSATRISNWIRKHDNNSKFCLIEANENQGFSAGNNIGIDNCPADYYVLLNSDTLVRPGALSVLMQTAKDHPNAGLVTPRLEWQDAKPQESCFRYPSPITEMMSAANTGVITKLFKNHRVVIPISDHLSHPPWSSFACVLIRQKLISQIGMLDDKYFMYFEDADYCFFARQAGWDIINNPTARIVHLRGGSSSVKKSFRDKTRIPTYYMAARSRYFYKIGGRAYLLSANIAWYAGRTISKIREIFGHSKMVCENQAIDIWINWKSPGTTFKPDL